MRHTSITYLVLRSAIRGFAATILVLLILMAGLIFAVMAQAKRHEGRRVDAILVMGAAQWDGNPSPVLQARLDSAFNLYRRGYASRIILTGGVAPGDDLSEAAASRDYLIQRGVDPAILLLEEQGRSTFSSLRAAVEIARQHGITSIILVSDPYHELRALKIARDHGLEAYGEPARNSIPSDNFVRAELIVREAWAYLAYVLLGGS